jgi:exopolysaccharide/PEP-CTERM locus tyrosine autokinase
MSKIEEALEKANKMRGPKREAVRVSELEVPKRINPAKVNNPYIVTVTQADSLIAEEYRRLKSLLIRETKADFLNSIMVTSSVEGEGKTLTSINLAITLAQEIDHSILLVDADLRKPMIHKYLGVSCKYGLSDYLAGDVPVSEILVKTGIGNLVLLPAGRTVSNPVELLASDKMHSLIKELKQRYMDRYVIIDTPPILAYAEAISIGSAVDGVIFVVQERGPQKKLVENALSQIKNLNILGIVLNNSDTTNFNGQYSYYYRNDKHKKGEKR